MNGRGARGPGVHVAPGLMLPVRYLGSRRQAIIGKAGCDEGQAQGAVP